MPQIDQAAPLRLKSRKGIMIGKCERAVDCFRRGFNCCQAVFSTYAPDLACDPELALRIGTGFGAGMAGLQRTCGAVTGAFMIVGLKHGRLDAEDTDNREKAYGLIREISGRFISKHGSLDCIELLGCDLNTPDGEEHFEANNMIETRCANFVRDAALLVEELIFEGGSEDIEGEPEAY